MAPRGDKSAYTTKQKRQAEHIEQSALDEGHSQESAVRIAWATVNKTDGGGKRSGSGRGADRTAGTTTTKKKPRAVKTRKGKTASSSR